jgi:hypothetical protein
MAGGWARRRHGSQTQAFDGCAMNKDHQLGDAPIDEKYRQMMNDVARALDDIFNGGAKGPDRTTGFVLLVFPFGSEDGRCNYISNGADRDDIVVLLKEQIKRFEGQPDISGSA